MITETFYKFTRMGGRPSIAIGKRAWDEPVMVDGAWVPGKWRSVRGTLAPCANGLHASTPEMLWLHISEDLYAVEAVVGDKAWGKFFDEGDKVVFRKGRLTRRILGWDDNAKRRLAAIAARATVTLARQRIPLEYFSDAVFDYANALVAYLDYLVDHWYDPLSERSVQLERLRLTHGQIVVPGDVREMPMPMPVKTCYGYLARALENMQAAVSPYADSCYGVTLSYPNLVRHDDGMAKSWVGALPLLDPEFVGFFPALIRAEGV